ncbi:kinetochore-associated protein KNL-2 [Salvia divinorum]|uniref:Kinetochore-associated protein KNL-2 n=1 Tax=Salvia divinorum TaxID=28513 RepID=A0ABD1IM24_SALDI
MTSPSTSAPFHRANSCNFQKSHFQRTVCLADWWLVKSENEVQGRRLAVGGLTDRGKQARREFTSAPILKSYDDFTIETTDGICVILKGFINKDRTLEHGFLSDVFNHFVFGFPLYWKEYDEKFLGKEPPSKDIVTDKFSDQLSQGHGLIGGAHPHLDSHEKDLGSQGRIEAKGRRKGKQAKSLDVQFSLKHIVSGLQEESYCGGGTCVEDHTAPLIPANCLESEIKSLSDLSCDTSIKIKRGDDNSRKIMDKKANTNSDWDMSSEVKIPSHSEVRAMARSKRKFRMIEMNNQKSTGISDCEKIRFNSISSVGYGNVESRLVVDQEPVSSNNWNSEDKGIREIKSRSSTHKAKNEAEGLPSTPAVTTKSHDSHCTPVSAGNQRDTLRMKEMNNQRSTGIADIEKIGFNSISSIGSGKVESELVVDQEPDKGIRELKTRSSTHKAKNKAEELPFTPAVSTKSHDSHHTPTSADNQRGTLTNRKSSLSEKAKALGKSTRQKFVPVSKETPEREKEKGWNASPQSYSFNRSRSGRLLMPTLEFWRNQRAIYDTDRTITGVEEGMDP